MSAEAVQASVAALRAAYDELAALPIDGLTKSELVDALDEVETVTCQLGGAPLSVIKRYVEIQKSR